MGPRAVASLRVCATVVPHRIRGGSFGSMSPGLQLPRLGFGTAAVGGLFERVAEDDARATIHAAFRGGIAMFDTAPLYGLGLSERRLGQALADLPRDEVLVSTKVGRLLRAGATPEPSQGDVWAERGELNPVFDFTADGVRRSLEESLARLQIDRVDVVHVHDPDDHYGEALDGAIPALCRLRDEGTIRAVGVGMNQAAMLARLVRAADLDCVLVAGRYTLLDQSALDELLPGCLERGVQVIVGGVFNSGILAESRLGATYDYVPASSDVLDRVERIRGTCARYGVPLKAAALQFPLAHPAVRTLLVGPRSVSEVTESLDLVQRPIPAALWDDLRRQRLLRDEAPVPAA